MTNPPRLTEDAKSLRARRGPSGWRRYVTFQTFVATLLVVSVIISTASFWFAITEDRQRRARETARMVETNAAIEEVLAHLENLNEYQVGEMDHHRRANEDAHAEILEHLTND